jgi:hypothetical protein
LSVLSRNQKGLPVKIAARKPAIAKGAERSVGIGVAKVGKVERVKVATIAKIRNRRYPRL